MFIASNSSLAYLANKNKKIKQESVKIMEVKVQIKEERDDNEDQNSNEENGPVPCQSCMKIENSTDEEELEQPITVFLEPIEKNERTCNEEEKIKEERDDNEDQNANEELEQPIAVFLEPVEKNERTCNEEEKDPLASSSGSASVKQEDSFCPEDDELDSLECSSLEKVIAKKEHLEANTRILPRGRPFQCSICLKNFTGKGHLKSHILIHAFTMYILMVAANNWLTAVSLNMASGFSVLQGRRPGTGRERRRFLWLCAGAWGLTAALATAAIATFFTTAIPKYIMLSDTLLNKKYQVIRYNGPWYMPSFLETRTCFNDIKLSEEDDMKNCATNKMGSLLFYFGPVSALLVVNVVCLATTARRVHFLRRGNSLLQRAIAEGGGGGRRAVSHAQSIMVYVKLLLSAGAIETVTEIVLWASSHSSGSLVGNYYQTSNHSHTYRTVGSFCDLFRALCVLWLAAPDAHEKMATLWRRLMELATRSTKKQ